jgi:hypothetical protein
MRTTTTAACALVTLTLAAGPAVAQAPPQPGPEHQILVAGAGTWDAELQMAMPDGTTMAAKGVQVDTVGCGGLCLITDFKADMMGMPFAGHGITTWDPAVKKYVGAWSDSMSVGLSTTEGTYDAATKTMTSWMATRDMAGNPAKTRSVDAQPDPDHKSMTMFMTGPDGKEAQGMKITYTRRK